MGIVREEETTFSSLSGATKLPTTRGRDACPAGPTPYTISSVLTI